ncbi:MAG: DNA replication and repair protein RecF, partial [Candidatus Competibacter sp.]
ILDRLRDAFCTALEGALKPLAARTLGEIGVVVDYRRGWPLEPSERDFVAWLRAGRGSDRLRGHTRLGPHRADFILRVAGHPPGAALSRGQQKLLVIALLLAQAELYRRRLGEACILLIDDLPAELDPGNRARVSCALAELDTQLFVTAIEPGLLDIAPWRATKTFALTGGEVREMI